MLLLQRCYLQFTVPCLYEGRNVSGVQNIKFIFHWLELEQRVVDQPPPIHCIYLVPDLESDLTFEDQDHCAISKDVRLVSSLQRVTDTKSSLNNE